MASVSKALGPAAIVATLKEKAEEGVPPQLWGAAVGLSSEALEEKVLSTPMLREAWPFLAQLAEAKVVEKLLSGTLKESTATLLLRVYFDRSPVGQRDAPMAAVAGEEEPEVESPFSTRE